MNVELTVANYVLGALKMIWKISLRIWMSWVVGLVMVTGRLNVSDVYVCIHIFTWSICVCRYTYVCLQMTERLNVSDVYVCIHIFTWSICVCRYTYVCLQMTGMLNVRYVYVCIHIYTWVICVCRYTYVCLHMTGMLNVRYVYARIHISARDICVCRYAYKYLIENVVELGSGLGMVVGILTVWWWWWLGCWKWVICMHVYIYIHAYTYIYSWDIWVCMYVYIWLGGWTWVICVYVVMYIRETYVYVGIQLYIVLRMWTTWAVGWGWWLGELTLEAATAGNYSPRSSLIWGGYD